LEIFTLSLVQRKLSRFCHLPLPPEAYRRTLAKRGGDSGGSRSAGSNTCESEDMLR
jgi:hypothetical protein